MNAIEFLRNRFAIACGAAILALGGSASAQWPNLPVAPLTIQALGDPNIVLTFDDSGSMAWMAVPDGRVNDGTWRRLAARWNQLAYNPFTLYEAPFDPVALDGTRLATTFTSATIYGFRPAGATENLSTNYQTHRSYQAINGAGNYGNGWADMDGDRVKFPIERAYFYAFYTDLGPGNALPAPGQDPATFTRNTVAPASCGGATSFNDEDCYVKVTVPVGSAHEQNFANWFSFYRTRNLLTASAANLAFYNLPQNFRVTWQGLTTCDDGFNSTSCNGFDGVNYSNLFRPLTDTGHRRTFFRWLSRVPHNGFTPLVQAMERAGQFYTQTGINSSIANQPGIALDGPGTAPTNTCRPSYHIMMTDGLWNGGASGTFGNVDGNSLTFGDGSTYTPQAPYSDTTGGTLADVAMHYWATDLQPGLANNISRYYPDPADVSFYNPRNDPANWQHMVNFTIGLGLGSILTGAGGQPQYLSSPNPNRPSLGTYLGSYPALANGTLAWPSATSGSNNTVSDLWHAALNSRGFFFSADNSQTMKKAFDEISSRIGAAQITSGQAGNTSARTGGNDNLSIRLSYDPSTWTSKLDAYKVRADGSLSALAWTTDTTLVNNSGRNIFSWNTVGSNGVPFTWSDLTAAQKTAWFKDDETLFNWVIGDRTNEVAVAPAFPKFRKREKLLADIINSDVIVSGKVDFGYGSIAGTIGSSYKNFVTSKQTLVYAGANGGMLHAFNKDGREVFAYVPSSVGPRLQKLAEDPYVHENYVDGPLALWDYYRSGWRSILVGGLAGGGKTVFGLDVTNVQKGTPFSSADVLFEINDPELGYSFSRPIVARQPNGEWVAIFGNGYGGASSKAILFVYNLSTKTLTKIDTGEGTAAAPNGLGSPVGLSLQTGTINAAYVGDYQGNLWRFNVSSTGTWSIAHGGAPFFVAKDSGGKRQPITAAPTLIKHPAGGTMVIFGTGKFFETQDRAELHVQSMYGLRDIGNAKIPSRASLVAQTITAGNNSTANFRALSNNAVDYTAKAGWYLDLNSADGGVATGEKVVASPIQLNDGTTEYIFFNTFIPSRSTCEGIGSGYFMFANAFTGGLSSSKIDINNDGDVNALDLVGGKPAAAVRQSTGSLSSPTAQLVSFGTSNFANTGAATAGSCGGLGQPTCPGDRCIQPFVPRNGICSKSACGPGNVMVNNQYCFTVGKTATWMELK
jgi:type IV pilus assembly protein PilY1